MIIEGIPSRRYKTIYADPPWKYQSKSGRGMKSGAAEKYETMDIEDIKHLPFIHDIVDPNSVLFLWVTTPLLPDGIEVLRAWGFEYKTAIYWRKIMSQGMGWWFRGQVEVCLFGVRGNVKALRIQKANFIQSKARKHSRKPEELFEMIEQAIPKPAIELFAREARDGWDCWGHGVSGEHYRNVMDLRSYLQTDPTTEVKA